MRFDPPPLNAMAIIAFLTNIGLAIVAALACWDAYVERASPARRRKLAGAVLAVLVTGGTLYLRYVQSQDMAFVKATAAAAAHAMGGGL
jgi:hypothetical protein